MTSVGKVLLVGAGPGDPDLITRRGLWAIAQAQVLVYDRLVAPALVAEAPAGCELIYVGKEGNGHHAMTQAAINQALVQHAQAGRLVVRLKGGDPFVFGRGGEEAAALAAAAIPFEVVPGITAGVGAAAYAGIPVTHRGLSTTAIFVTGHDAAESDPAAAPDWEQLGRLQATLVIYMGLTHLSTTAARLIAAGRPSNTPAAVIRWGTRAEQETVTGTLTDIAERAKRIKSPALVVIGEVVALREQIGWAEERALAGQRVLIAGTGALAAGAADAVRDLGGEPWTFSAADLQAKAHLAPLLQQELGGATVAHVLLLDPDAAAPLAEQVGLAALGPCALICAGGLTARAARVAGLTPTVTTAAEPDALRAALLAGRFAPALAVGAQR